MKYKFILVCLLTAALFAAAIPVSLKPRSADSVAEIQLPIIMYHSVLKDKARTGKYIITPSSIRSDLEYLSEHGYTGITVSDLTAYVFRGEPLPQKPVMLTFDDGHYNNLTYLPPLLEEFGFPAVISVVGQYVELYTENGDTNPNYAYLNLDAIAELLSTGRIEIQSHTYSLHTLGLRRGAAKIASESPSDYERLLSGDLMRLQRLLLPCGAIPVALAYPFGAYSAESDGIIRRLGFVCTFTCEEKLNLITSSPESLFGLGRFNRDGRLSTAEFMRMYGIK